MRSSSEVVAVGKAKVILGPGETPTDDVSNEGRVISEVADPSSSVSGLTLLGNAPVTENESNGSLVDSIKLSDGVSSDVSSTSPDKIEVHRIEAESRGSVSIGSEEESLNSSSRPDAADDLNVSNVVMAGLKVIELTMSGIDEVSETVVRSSVRLVRDSIGSDSILVAVLISRSVGVGSVRVTYVSEGRSVTVSVVTEKPPRAEVKGKSSVSEGSKDDVAARSTRVD